MVPRDSDIKISPRIATIARVRNPVERPQALLHLAELCRSDDSHLDLRFIVEIALNELHPDDLSHGRLGQHKRGGAHCGQWIEPASEFFERTPAVAGHFLVAVEHASVT